MAKLDTVHITDGKTAIVVNKCDFEAGKFKGYELVSKPKKADKPKKGKK